MGALHTAVSQAHTKLASTISGLSQEQCEARVIPFTGGTVDVRDILAYQIGWGRLLISWYTDGLRGKVPTMPGEGFTTWDYVGLARIFYKKYRGKNVQAQLGALETLVKQILDIIEHEAHTHNLDRVGIWPWCTLPSGIQWPLSKWIRVNTVAPYTRAAKLIKKHA